MLFIFIVVVAPGVTDAMFYYESNVIGLDSTQFGMLYVCSSVASILGVWAYRSFFTKIPLKIYFFVVTVLLALALESNMVIVNVS